MLSDIIMLKTDMMKKTLRGAQKLRAGCSNCGAKNFCPVADPLPRGGRDGQNLISSRWSLPLPKNQVWWGSMHAISSYRGNRPIPPARHRQGRLQYTAPRL